jgi:hypothetical protein
MIECWQQWGNAIRGDTALTTGVRPDRVHVELSDEGGSRQAVGDINTADPPVTRFSLKVSARG